MPNEAVAALADLFEPVQPECQPSHAYIFQNLASCRLDGVEPSCFESTNRLAGIAKFDVPLHRIHAIDAP